MAVGCSISFLRCSKKKKKKLRAINIENTITNSIFKRVSNVDLNFANYGFGKTL